MQDTVAGFREILDGQLDDLPEQAFYMAGAIDEVKANAKKMAAA
jgi:F-type H+-transporting ATPase subunit beta